VHTSLGESLTARHAHEPQLASRTTCTRLLTNAVLGPHDPSLAPQGFLRERQTTLVPAAGSSVLAGLRPAGASDVFITWRLIRPGPVDLRAECGGKRQAGTTLLSKHSKHSLKMSKTQDEYRAATNDTRAGAGTTAFTH
jgi:hypothetical protein